MPNGNVFAVGGTPHTALFNVSTGTWTAGPEFPAVASGQQVLSLHDEDGPAALLPNGRVLVPNAPEGVVGTHFFEFDGYAFAEVAKTPNSPHISIGGLRLLVLPTGQVLQIEGDGTLDVEIYTPADGPNPAWAPTITSVVGTLTRGTTQVVTGTQFNGLSQASGYGDDAQSATNYPLVRITNVASGHVVYARTHDHSTMAVATGNLSVSTSFDVPPGIETGPSTLVVVANGIASAARSVTVQ